MSSLITVNKPLFHGTSTEFDTFSLDFCGSSKGVGFPLGHLGVYFTPSKALAEKFCKKKWDSSRSKAKKNARVVEVTLKDPRPILISPMQWIPYSGSPEEEIVAMRNSYLEKGYNCLVIERSDTYCPDELYEPQVVVLDPSIIVQTATNPPASIV